MISSRGSAPGAGPGPGMTARAGQIPVRITLTWDFGPGAPARWLRMTKNRYATRLLVPRGRPVGLPRNFAVLLERRAFEEWGRPSFVMTAGTPSETCVTLGKDRV